MLPPELERVELPVDLELTRVETSSDLVEEDEEELRRQLTKALKLCYWTARANEVDRAPAAFAFAVSVTEDAQLFDFRARDGAAQDVRECLRSRFPLVGPSVLEVEVGAQASAR